MSQTHYACGCIVADDQRVTDCGTHDAKDNPDPMIAVTAAKAKADAAAAAAKVKADADAAEVQRKADAADLRSAAHAKDDDKDDDQPHGTGKKK